MNNPDIILNLCEQIKEKLQEIKIEEDKKIEKIEDIYTIDHRWQSENNNILINKINELIDVINEILVYLIKERLLEIVNGEIKNGKN